MSAIRNIGRIKNRLLNHDAVRTFCKPSKKIVEDCCGKNVVFIDLVRTPFLMSGTDYRYALPHELGSHAIRSLMQKTELPGNIVDHVIYSTVVQEALTPDIARDSTLCAGLPPEVPAHTIIQACTGSNQGISSGVAMIAMGKANCVVCGGVDVLSNMPIVLSRRLRVLTVAWLKAKTLTQKLKVLSQIKADIFAFQFAAISEFSTGKPPGHSAEKVAAAFKVSRKEQDEFALRSHRLAAQAQEKGYLSDVVPYMVPQSGKVIEKDNGIRNSSADKLSKLKPTFVKSFGTVTPGNSTFLTDGASACLLMTESKAKELGLKPKAYIRNFVTKSHDPILKPLMSPTECMATLLSSSNLTLEDIDVWEMHEAFAAQMIATLKAMDSDYYCREHMKLTGKLGMLDVTKLNNWGGSLSLGHPFAATGTRVCAHAVNRLIREDGQLAIAAVCAAGGQGAAMLIERHPDGVI